MCVNSKSTAHARTPYGTPGVAVLLNMVIYFSSHRMLLFKETEYLADKSGEHRDIGVRRPVRGSHRFTALAATQ